MGPRQEHPVPESQEFRLCFSPGSTHRGAVPHWARLPAAKCWSLGMLKINQCSTSDVVLWSAVSGSSTMIAKLTVPAGTWDHCKGGEIGELASAVYWLGMMPPSSNAVVVRVSPGQPDFGQMPAPQSTPAQEENLRGASSFSFLPRRLPISGRRPAKPFRADSR